MIGCLRTRVRKQPIIALYFETEIVLTFYNLKARHIFFQNSVDPDQQSVHTTSKFTIIIENMKFRIILTCFILV